MCGYGLELIAELNSKKNETITIPDSNYACEYRIVAPTLTYRTSSKILLWVEGTYFTNVYIYSGSSRSNLTTVIESN
jgi:hypothetical protein